MTQERPQAGDGDRQIGLFLYGWYEKSKWQAHRFPGTPQIGFYDSRDPVLAQWQADQIARLGIDFVAFEMVPIGDISFETILIHTRNCIPRLATHDVGYSLFIDFAFFNELDDPIGTYRRTFRQFAEEGWLDGSYDHPEFGKAIYLFAPWPEFLDPIRAATPAPHAIKPLCWHPEWGRIDPTRYSSSYRAILGRYWRDSVDRGVTLEESMRQMGYAPFWQYTAEMTPMNGIAAVCASFDDLMLGRDPQLTERLPRFDGQTLVDQFRIATESDAGTFLIYGWNEYFEDATLEPTLEHGDFYTRLTAELIAQLRRGEAVRMPEGLGQPQSVAPLLLTEDLAGNARQQPDGVPRWAFDDFVAAIEVPGAAVYRDGDALFERVGVRNAGRRDWPTRGSEGPVLLGIRLLTEDGRVAREGRAALASERFEPGRQAQVDLAVALGGLPPGIYQARIDVVWEDRFWFGVEEQPVEVSIAGWRGA